MALLFVPQGIEQRGYRLNVTTAGVSIPFRTAFSNIRLVKGDYHLTVHGYDSTDEGTKTEVYCRTVESPTGFNLFPDKTCAYITYTAEPLTEDLTASTIPTIQTGVASGLKPQSGSFASDTDAANASAAFTDVYPDINYNVKYVRAYLASDMTIPVPITMVTKTTAGLIINVPTDGCIVDWGVEPRTQ